MDRHRHRHRQGIVLQRIGHESVLDRPRTVAVLGDRRRLLRPPAPPAATTAGGLRLRRLLVVASECRGNDVNRTGEREGIDRDEALAGLKLVQRPDERRRLRREGEDVGVG